MPLIPFGVTVNGTPIDEYIFLPSQVSMNYSLAFEEMEARAAYGIPEHEYNQLPGNPLWITDGGISKAHVVMWYRKHQRLNAVPYDVQAREMKKNRKR